MRLIHKFNVTPIKFHMHTYQDMYIVLSFWNLTKINLKSTWKKNFAIVVKKILKRRPLKNAFDTSYYDMYNIKQNKPINNLIVENSEILKVAFLKVFLSCILYKPIHFFNV